MCLASLLKEAIDQKCLKDKQKRTWAEIINEQLLIKAGNGDLQAIRLIYEYVEGKPNQKQDVAGEITIKVVYDEGEDGRG